MDYFYCPPENITPTSLVIDGDEFSHLVHVMRGKEGDEIRVVDGKGTAYDVRLGEIKKRMVQATIHHTYQLHHEPGIDVTIAVGLLKNPSKFDFLVEKATELGVRTIIPLVTERTISRHAKSDRWQKLALAAMKQCGRAYLPQVRGTTTLEELLSDSSGTMLKFVAHEKASGAQSARLPVFPPGSAVTFLVGPEGGFSDREIGLAQQAGYLLLYLGERRMRTETAATALATLALIAPGCLHLKP